MVKGRRDQKLLLRSFDARHGKIESGAVIKNRKGTSGVEVGKKKASVRKETVAVFWHESNGRAQKPEHTAGHTFRAILLTRSKCVEENEVSKAKVTMVPFSDNRADYLKGTCARTPCEYWHPPECQVYKTETSCNAGDKCLFPHYNVCEQPNKKPKKSWPGGWGPQGMFLTSGGGLARVPKLHVCKHFSGGVAHAGRKDGLTSCRGTVPVGVRAHTSSESQKEGEIRLPAKGKWSPRGTGTTVLTCACPSQPYSAGSEGVRQGNRRGL